MKYKQQLRLLQQKKNGYKIKIPPAFGGI